MQRERKRLIPRIRPTDELVEIVAKEYLNMADSTKPDVTLALRSYIAKLEGAINEKFSNDPSIKDFPNKWGGSAFRHDDITICAMRAKGLIEEEDPDPLITRDWYLPDWVGR